MKKYNYTTQKIRNLCKENGLTCRELAELTGINLSIVYNLYNGDQLGKYDQIEKIATVFGLTVKDLAPRTKFSKTGYRTPRKAKKSLASIPKPAKNLKPAKAPKSNVIKLKPKLTLWQKIKNLLNKRVY